MLKRKALAAALFASALGAMPFAASADRLIVVEVAPPPPRHEVVPAPRHGYVWAPGHWEWNGRRYHWTSGTWMRERAGYRFESPEWVHREGRWYYERRGWHRDSDHDGVPNRFD